MESTDKYIQTESNLSRDAAERWLCVIYAPALENLDKTIYHAELTKMKRKTAAKEFISAWVGLYVKTRSNIRKSYVEKVDKMNNYVRNFKYEETKDGYQMLLMYGYRFQDIMKDVGLHNISHKETTIYR